MNARRSITHPIERAALRRMALLEQIQKDIELAPTASRSGYQWLALSKTLAHDWYRLVSFDQAMLERGQE